MTEGQSFRVEVVWCHHTDGRALDLQNQLSHLKAFAIDRVEIVNLTFLKGPLTPADIDRIADELLADPVTEQASWEDISTTAGQETSAQAVEVGFHPGVTDPVAKHVLHRAHQLGIPTLQDVTTGTRYIFYGELTKEDLDFIARELLCNQVIQSYSLGKMKPEFVPDAQPSDQVEIIPLRNLDENTLGNLSRERVLFLSVPEMQAIQEEYRRLQRDPTDVELEILAQTWSEHCLHKTFKSPVHYRCEGGIPRVLPGKGMMQITQTSYEETIPSLIGSYLRAATDVLDRPWVRSAFVDNAGIIDFDDRYEVSFKVETHNHPSALEPFGGANTGVGGVIRDIIGVSARPIANTDVLCFGPLSLPEAHVPDGTLHPRRIARGVVAGTRWSAPQAMAPSRRPAAGPAADATTP
ncbi:MAG: phosphoribosylformylglycinamidine synthase subunit PurS [Anaerolineae bacterium]|nr:phosphoribosylformylglycinamidine synthase subunit PurS [Anaerolineae bacterium]